MALTPLRPDRLKNTDALVSTRTVTSTEKFDNGIVDISIIPFIRPLEIDFIATGLKPNRKVWFFFDDVNVNKYILQSSEIEIAETDANTSFNMGVSNVESLSNSSSNTATIIGRRRRFGPSDDGGSNIRKRVLDIIRINGQLGQGAGIAGSFGSTGTINNAATFIDLRSDYNLQTFFGDHSQKSMTASANTTSGSEFVFFNTSVLTDNRALSVANNNTDIIKIGALAEVEVINISANGLVVTVNDASRITATLVANTVLARNKANSVILNRQTAFIANNYWGTDGANTISFIPRRRRGRKAVVANIVGFDNVSRRLYLSNTRTNLVTQLDTSAGDADLPTPSDADANDVMWSINTSASFYTTREGQISGTFIVPGNTFRTGERLFRVIDTPTNDPEDCTTRAEYKFVASGLKAVKNSIVIKTVNQQDVTPPPPPTTPPSQPVRAPVGCCCFVAGTKVLLADGSEKNIEDVSIGDKLIGKDGVINTVQFLLRPQLKDLIGRWLISFNGKNEFVTSDHPFWTRDGFWKSYDPNATKRIYEALKDWDIRPIEIGDIIETHDGKGFEIKSLSIHAGSDEEQTLYNFGLDGNHTYIADGLVTHNKGGDPLAQTFYVSAREYPNGIFIPKIGIWFRSKDEILPVTVQIRPVVNGYPHSSEIIPGAEKTIDAEDVTAYSDTDSPYSNTASLFSDSVGESTPGTSIYPRDPTVFKFDTPVYLPPGEYALVILSSSVNYEVFVAELGEKVIGTPNKIQEQPYMGSFFKSQNSSTWDAIQMEDLMFVLYRCVFTSPGTVTFGNIRPFNNVNADLYYTHSEDVKLPNTNITYVHSIDSGGSYRDYEIDTPYVPLSRQQITNVSDNQYRLQATLTTNDDTISPVLVANSYLLIAAENFIDNAEIANNNITIVTPGSGYGANLTNIAVTITAQHGAGANVYAVSNAGGMITSFTVNDGGDEYFANASVTIGGAGSGAVGSLNTEVDNRGGVAAARYVSKVVTLADGFDAGDLKVYLTAYKPPGTAIKVYYKVRNTLDPETFDQKLWTLMELDGTESVYSSRADDLIEFQYGPQGLEDHIEYTSGTNTYRSFGQFAVKLVLMSDNTVYYPIIYDLRAIALPSNE